MLEAPKVSPDTFPRRHCAARCGRVVEVSSKYQVDFNSPRLANEENPGGLHARRGRAIS